MEAVCRTESQRSSRLAISPCLNRVGRVSRRCFSCTRGSGGKACCGGDELTGFGSSPVGPPWWPLSFPSFLRNLERVTEQQDWGEKLVCEKALQRMKNLWETPKMFRHRYAKWAYLTNRRRAAYNEPNCNTRRGSPASVLRPAEDFNDFQGVNFNHLTNSNTYWRLVYGPTVGTKVLLT